MNREFKFRAWDLLVGEMVYDVGVKGNFVCWKNSMDEIIWRSKNQWIPMQFVCSRNGNEIYEGDIVNHGDNYPAVVMWNDNAFESAGFHLVEYGKLDGEKDYPRSHAFWAYNNPIEIIGNIWENPELLGSGGKMRNKRYFLTHKKENNEIFCPYHNKRTFVRTCQTCQYKSGGGSDDKGIYVGCNYGIGDSLEQFELEVR